MQAKAFTATFLSLAVQYAEASKCYGIAFSSGNESAAYQAGVLKGLVESYNADEVSYTNVSGIAGGAVNAAILASYDAGKESDAAAHMTKFW